jgi:hypothetical protein
MKQHLWIKRKHPRFKADIHCVVGLPNSDLSDGQIHDLSVDGLRFGCARHTIHNILPENRRTPGPVMDIVVEIHFELQLPNLTAQAVKCKATLVHFERLAQDEFHVGVQFINMNKTATKALEAFLETAQEKQNV